MNTSVPLNGSCKLCHKKRARRYCPGTSGEICPACCGAERENTIDCPSSCEYLKEARLRERPAPQDPETVPNRDVPVSERFIEEKADEVVWLGTALAASMDAGRAVDFDAREALAALIQTYRTLESGLIYEARPQNPYAAAIQDDLKRAIEELRKRLAEQSGMHTLRDADVLGMLIFLQRLELRQNNGRRRGRAFYDFLRSYFPAGRTAGAQTAGVQL